MRPPKKLPPWSRHHESWCAVFRGKPGDCDDDDHRPASRRRSPLSGGDVPPKRERVLEEA
jgi:hypothetical protein